MLPIRASRHNRKFLTRQGWKMVVGVEAWNCLRTIPSAYDAVVAILIRKREGGNHSIEPDYIILDEFHLSGVEA